MLIKTEGTYSSVFLSECLTVSADKTKYQLHGTNESYTQLVKYYTVRINSDVHIAAKSMLLEIVATDFEFPHYCPVSTDKLLYTYTETYKVCKACTYYQTHYFN